MDGATRAPGEDSPDQGERAHHAPGSVLILAAARSWPQPRISLGEMIEALGRRSYGLLIVLFALPNLLPISVPGLGSVFGVALGILCAQLALGYPTPRLPGALTRWTMRRAELQAIAERVQPALRRIEQLVRPRPSWLTGARGERLIGAFGVLLALVVLLPLPFTNIPPSLACAVMAIGLMEEDSATILVGAGIGVLAVLLALAVIAGTWWLAVQLLTLLFGG